MPKETRIVAPGPRERTVITGDGQVLQPPPDWELLPPGDATLTRRVKAGGPCWTVQQKKGRKTFSYGVWAPAERIRSVRQQLEAERAEPSYEKRRAADVARRQRQQVAYAEDFRGAVLEFLNFDARHGDLAERLADRITAHATPVGSGTVARTQRLPITERAERAVIAWMRHQTTAYDEMKIPRLRGKRREVRRMLAEQSRHLLRLYRTGQAVVAEDCPLQQALARRAKSEADANSEASD